MHGAPVVHGPRAGATMPAMSTERSPEPARPLTLRAILFSAAAIVVTGGVVMVLLLTLYGSGSPQDQARLDAVRTAGAIVISFAGAAALLLTARRQRTGELTLEHQQRVAELADHDAAERRVTELYLKAAEQLGSEKAPVRLAGLYALERLGDSNPSQRETVISVICAYLRMPFTHPGDRPAATADAAEHAEHQERSRELQVRTTALRILHRHRTTAAPQTWWAGTVDVDGADLVRAYLPGIGLSEASLYRANPTEADLTGADLTHADLTAAILTGANLTGADLTTATLDDADLDATILTRAVLAGTLLTGATWSEATRWPDEKIRAVVAAASAPLPDGRFRISELTMPR